MKVFRAEITTPIPLDFRPCPFPFAYSKAGEGEVLVELEGLIGNRAAEIDFACRVFFPAATKVEVWDTAVPEDTSHLRDLGAFGQSEAIIPVKLQDMLDIMEIMASAKVNGHLPGSVAADLQRGMDCVASLVHFTKGDSFYVNGFADLMDRKLREAAEKGRKGWQDPAMFSDESLQARISLAIADKDYVSLANYALMAFWRSYPIWKA